MITLSADNRALSNDSKYSYLTTNYPSGSIGVNVLNAQEGFEIDTFVLLGNFGSENAEIARISTVNKATGDFVFSAVTKFSHSESTRVTVIPYNQVRFFWTATEVIDNNNPLTGYIDIQPSDWFSTYVDEANSTGFGWFIFYNSLTATTSQPSNSLPYTGFDNSSIEDIINDFYSLLNSKDLKLVTRQDALSWLNEGYSRMRNRLNMTNVEYSATALTPLNLVGGVSEYDLPVDFYQLSNITAQMTPGDPTASGNMSKFPIDYIPLRLAFSYMGTQLRYYIRGKKIGFVPTPSEPQTLQYMYMKKTTRLDSNSDLLDLPDNGFYCIKDFMMYRAYMKFNNPNAAIYLKAFNDGIDQMVIAAMDRDASLDWTDIAAEANC